MSVKTEYKQQADAFYNARHRVTAEELLLLAKEREVAVENQNEETGEVIDFTEKRIRKAAWKKFLSAACIVVVISLATATVTLAATGKLGELFRYFFKDDTTADLVEEGYFYDINQSATEGIFRVDLVAVAGDINTPKLVFDVYVDDTNLTSLNERIYLSAYTLGVEQYENELDHYSTFEGWGEKDAEIDNLYHVSIDGASTWISHGEPVVVSVREIRFEHMAQPYYMNLEYRFTLPAESLYPVVQTYYEGSRFPYEKEDYYLNYVEYGAYNTGCSFMFPYDGESLEGQYTTREDLEALLQMRWDSFKEGLVLLADGVEYGRNPEMDSVGYIDTEGIAGPTGWFHVWVYFPKIDVSAAKEIYLKHGDSKFQIK